MAVFEIEPAFGAADHFRVNDAIANVRIRYHLPKDSSVRTMLYNCRYDPIEFKDLPTCHQFATSVVMFGGLLKGSKYFKNVSWNDVIIMAEQTHNPADPVQKEMIALLEKAKKIYSKKKKKTDS